MRSPTPKTAPFIGREACKGGSSGYCSQLERHDLCAHRVGGPQEAGVWSPSAYLERRHRASKGCVIDDQGQPIPVGPWHLWRCACTCHTDPQLTGLLF